MALASLQYNGQRAKIARPSSADEALLTADDNDEAVEVGYSTIERRKLAHCRALLSSTTLAKESSTQL